MIYAEKLNGTRSNTIVRMTREGACRINGCPGGIRSRGWCRRHYESWRRLGDENEVDRRGRRANGTGSIHKDGYLVIRVDGRSRLEHRVVWERHHGSIPAASHHVHHLNGDRRDNRIENLELIPAGVHIALHKRKQYDCNEEGCSEPHKARGYCDMHYTRRVRAGLLQQKPRRSLRTPPARF